MGEEVNRMFMAFGVKGWKHSGFSMEGLTNSGSKENNMQLIMLLSMVLSFIFCAYSEELTDHSFRRFWADFRQTVISTDKTKITSLTHFPFEVLGPDDSDSVKFLDRKGFLDIYERLVGQTIYFPSGGQIVSKTMLQMINETKEIPKKDTNKGDAMQFQQFEFEVIGGKWRFVRAYLEE